MIRRADSAQRRLDPDQKVWVLAVLLVLVAGSIQTGVLRTSVTRFEAPLHVPWWSVAIAFLLAEVLVVHLPARRSSHTISLAEVATVFGLVFAAPGTLIVGRLVGSGVALAVHRRQTPLKLAFNLASFYAELVAALLVLHLIDPVSLTSPDGWGGVIGAVIVATGVGVISVTAAISIYDQSASYRSHLTHMWSGTGISIAVGLMATIWAVLIWVDARSWPLVLATAAGAYGSVRVFGKLYQRYDELDTLHGFSTAIARSGDSVEIAVDTMLSLTATRLRVPSVAVVLRRLDGKSLGVWETNADGVVSHRTDDRELAEVLAPLAGCPHATVCGCSSTLIATAAEALAVPVSVGETPMGVLAVTDRDRPLEPLGESDRKMLTTMAQQFGSIVVRIEANERLQAQVIEKQRLIESKDQLIASVSHEVRTPLTAVMGFAEIMRDDIRSFTREELEALSTSVATEATELSYIVEDLLTAARADLGRLAAHARPVEVLDEVRRAVAHVTGPGDETVEVHGTSAYASADPGRLRQIVRNLAANAFRHGESPVIARVLPGPETISIQLIDHGPGVPDGAEDRVFEAYESAGGEASQPASVGLGLAISRDLAHLMGGTLVYRRNGDTTIFELRLEAVTTVSYGNEIRRTA